MAKVPYAAANTLALPRSIAVNGVLPGMWRSPPAAVVVVALGGGIAVVSRLLLRFLTASVGPTSAVS